MSQNGVQAKTCRVCQKPAVHSCSRCLAVNYCSKDHQKVDWKVHKLSCFPIKVVDSETVGRRFIATQLIAPNGTILREAPLLIGPKQVSAPLCLGCHLHTAELMPCSRCGWPVCSPACAASRNHLPECTLSSRCRRTKLDPAKLSSSPYMLGCIIVLRALYLKETNAEAWKQLMSLQSHSAARRVMDKHDLDSVNVVAFIRDFLRLRDYDSDLMDEIIGIVDTNAFVVPRMDICAIYHRASMAEHSCLFNTVQTFDEDLVLTLKAVREIKPGEPVTICYTDPLWGTRNRRFHLAETKLFDCLCERCRDPFELGTNLSSLKCSKCAKGSLVNVTPLVEPGKWACVCGHEVTWLEAERVLGKFGERLSKLEDKVGKCEAFIEDCLSVLHPNHFYILEAGSALLGMYQNTPSHLLTKGQIKLRDQLGSRIKTVSRILMVEGS